MKLYFKKYICEWVERVRSGFKKAKASSSTGQFGYYFSLDKVMWSNWVNVIYQYIDFYKKFFSQDIHGLF